MPVARMRARLREATLGFELLDEGPLALAPGEAATIEIGKASAVEDDAPAEVSRREKARESARHEIAFAE